MSEGDYSYIPEGYHTVTPSLTVTDAAGALAFYGEALGAVEVYRLPNPKTGEVLHAEFAVGNSRFMLSPEVPAEGAFAPEVGKGTLFFLYVEDCDACYGRAVEAGGTVIQEPTDMFWGDRVGKVADGYGYRWAFGQRVREVGEEEIMEAVKGFVEGGGG
ncbi:MAG: VOC family protein [Verrucomicrobiota bacterium]